MSAPRGGIVAGCVALALGVFACGRAEPPPTRELIHLSGSPYQRGLQHGQLLKEKIHSFYTRMLTASLLPYLGREQPDIQSLLSIYGTPKYQNGQFAHQLLVDSAKSIEASLPSEAREEMKGISDGSGLPYEDVLVLNTFTDSVLAVRGIALAIRLSRAPRLEALWVDGADADGVDNDGDGTADQPNEGVLDPFVPTPYAQLVELPGAPVFHARVNDPDGIDPKSIRFELDGKIYSANSTAIATSELGDGGVQIDFTPGDLGAPQVHTLVISLSDAKVLDRPAPSHESVMRDEEVAFTTLGTGLKPWEVRRPGLDDGRTRPPSFAVGVARSRAADGPVLAQNFALLDASAAHEHTVVLVHHPDHGPAFVTVGWAGVAYGFSGMNANGVAYACNPSDTLNNSIVQSVINQVADLSTARLQAAGVPIGFAARQVLENATDTQSAIDTMKSLPHVYGWSCAFADKGGDLEALELNSGTFDVNAPKFATYGPSDTDANGQRYGGDGDDELVVPSAYQKILDDAPILSLAGQRVVPQRYWSSFFYRSRRAADDVVRQLKPAMSAEDLEALIGRDELVDHSDSMNAVVMEPAKLLLHSAIGTEPANDAPYETLDLGAQP